MPKNGLRLKNRGLVPTIQPEQDFSLKCDFCEVLDSFELLIRMKFQKTLMTGCRDMSKKLKKYLKKGLSNLLPPPHIFLKVRHCHLFTLMVPQLHTKIRKTNGQSDIFKDGPRTSRQTDRSDYIGPLRAKPPQITSSTNTNQE